MKLFDLNPEAKMQGLVSILNQASDAYYNDQEIMTNYEYDELLQELQKLEESSGIVLPDSPTVKVGAPVKVDKLKKVKHEFPTKSLDKTKDLDKLCKAFDVKHNTCDEVVLMWKLDGSTVQLTYASGKLVLAATRGDGYIGQDITHNVPYIFGIPLTVNDKSRFTVRGEATISYEAFNQINKHLSDDQKFKNPRNLAASSITMLDPEDMKDRHVEFHAFELVDHSDMKNPESVLNKSFFYRLIFCSEQGFEVVPNALLSVHPDCELEYMRDFILDYEDDASKYPIPVDGLVIAYDDVSYTDQLEGTEHHPNILKGYAYKWKDEAAITVLRDIEWSPSRTGLLNPVAIFDPVELGGTAVKRASLHNYSIMKKLHLHIGDTIAVIKANKVIPQIVSNNSDSEEYSEDTFNREFNVVCSECGHSAVLLPSKDGVESVYCTNLSCPAKLIYKFEHFCERSAMNIEGLSESTLKKFVNLKYLEKFGDIYCLDNHMSEIKNLEGFGELSWNNLWEAIQNSRETTLEKFIVGVGIPNIGISQAKAISKYFDGDVSEFLNALYLDFSTIDRIGQVASQKILTWLHDAVIQTEIQDLLKHLIFKNTDKVVQGNVLSDLTFVVTGKVYHYANRKELEAHIEINGGKVASSVSKNTSYLINNDLNSTSSKNKKAKELGVPIISEEEFMRMMF